MLGSVTNNNWLRKFRWILVSSILLVPLALIANPGAGIQSVPGTAPQILKSASYVDEMDPSQTLKVRIWIKNTNSDDLQSKLHDIYTTGNSNYHKFLNTKELQQLYTASVDNINTVKQYLLNNGFVVESNSNNTNFIEINAKVADLERVFHVKMNNYMYKGVMRYSSNTAVSMDANVADKIAGISGLDDLNNPEPQYIVEPSVGAVPVGYSPTLIRQVYGLGESITPGMDGDGQTVVIIIAFDHPDAEKNLNTFSSRFGLPSCTVANGCFLRLNENGESAPLPTAYNSVWSLEADLDVQSVHTIAPKAKIILVEADYNSYGNMLFAIQNIVQKNLGSIISNSWGGKEFNCTWCDSMVFSPAALSGITINFSSGDYSDNKYAYGSVVVSYPSSSPLVTSVGGTRLILTPDGRYKYETAWADPGSSLGAGGGVSQFFLSNEWQHEKLESITAGGYGVIGSRRAVPDISMVADPNTGMVIYSSNAWTSVGGTSLASPLLSGMLAIANQVRQSQNKSRLGLLAPYIYNMPYNVHYGFAPITNVVGPIVTKTSVLSATPGWNDIAGLGSPYAPLFIEYLSNAD